MPDDWSPRILSKEAPRVEPVQHQELPAIIVKTEVPPSNIRGWKFVPERDANNLIIEIIATPIID